MLKDDTWFIIGLCVLGLVFIFTFRSLFSLSRYTCVFWVYGVWDRTRDGFCF